MGVSKSLAVAQHIIKRCAESGGPAVTPMQLIKLVYIAHGYMLGKHGRPLLDEPVQAWQYGPVVPSVYQAVKKFQSAPVTEVPCGAADVEFTPDELAVIDLVAKTYGKCGGITLSSATHQPGAPWRQTWEASGKNAPISNDLIEAFYVDILGKPSHSSL